MNTSRFRARDLRHARRAVATALRVGALAAVVLVNPGFAQTPATIVVTDGWSRATPAGATVAGGYLTITNKGAEPDRLNALSSDISARGEVHEMSMKDGIMTMRELSNGLDIAAGASVVLKPGGLHLMFQGLKTPLKVGQTIPVVLTFQKAGPITATLTVGTIAASGPPGHAETPVKADGMKMSH